MNVVADYNQSVFRHMPSIDREDMLKRIIKENLTFYKSKFSIEVDPEDTDTEIASKFLKFFYSQVNKTGTNLEKEKRIVKNFIFAYEEVKLNAIREMDDSFNFFLEHYFSTRALKILNKNSLFTDLNQLKDPDLRKKLIDKYKTIIEKNTFLKSNIDKKVTEIENTSEVFVSFKFFESTIEILERIAVVEDPKRKESNSILVKHIIDFEKGFLEFQWNKSSIKTLTKLNRESGSDGVTNDFKLINYLQSKLEEWFELDFSDQTIFNSLQMNSQSDDISDFRPSSIEDALQKSPLEAVLYQLFIEDHNNVLEKIKDETTEILDYDQLKHHINIFFKSQAEFKEQEVEDSTRFIENLNLSKKALTMDFMNSESYIFSFTLRDIVNYTSSKTKNDKREPIYANEPYWYLLNIVKRVKLITELSFHCEVIDTLKKARRIQKFSISAKNNILFFDYLQKKEIKDDFSKARYISYSRREISGNFKNRINKIINQQSRFSERISST